MMFKRKLICVIAAIINLTSVGSVLANDDKFVKYQQDKIAFQGVTLVDGSGQPALANQTVLIQNGKIVNMGPSNSFDLAKDTYVIDGKGKTLLPGFVMMHEHMFYPTGKANYTEMLHSFPRLYLAGGATTIRTAGTMAPYADLNLRDAVKQGRIIGPDVDVTAPYLNGPGLPILKVNALGGVADASRLVNYWADEGVTSYKAYMHIRQDELKKVIEIAHQRKHKVTAHLCSITYREAAELGIDNLEHGFLVATDFVKNKAKDQCPSGKAVTRSLADLDLESEEVKQLIQLLVDKNVALTSTLTIFETFAPGRPKAYDDALEVLLPEVRQQYTSRWQTIQQSQDSPWAVIFAKGMQLEKMFVEAGGNLIVGTDPTGYGGVVAGFASKRAIELLVETGFSFEESIYFATLNGAKFLNQEDTIGSISVGKRADLILVDGNPTQDISDIRKIETVFKNGIGYDSQSIIKSMKNTVGLH